MKNLILSALFLLCSLPVVAQEAWQEQPRPVRKAVINLRPPTWPTISQAIVIRLEELDGAPSGYVSKIRVSNGTLAISGQTGTITISGGGGTGDVVGPGLATDNAVARYDLTTGKLLQSSAVIIDDSGNTSGVGTLGSGAHTITDSGAACLAIGPNGNSNPVLRAVCNVASQADGISITGNAAGAGTTITALSSGSNAGFTFTPKGSGHTLLTSGRFQLGGTTSSFPAIGANGAALAALLADGSQFAAFTALTGSFGAGGTSSDITSLKIATGNAGVIGFTSTTGGNGTPDTGFARSAAAVIRVTNGSTGAGNLLISASTGAIGASCVSCLGIVNGTAPTGNSTDGSNIYNADSAAGDSNTFIRNEAGEINRLTGLASRNSAQFDVTSSTTRVSVTGMPRNVEAGRVYKFQGQYQTTSNVAGGVQFSISGTATATAISYEGVLMAAGAIVAQTRATALDGAVCALTAVTAGTCRIEGVIQVNAAGTIGPFFAQNASNGAASSVLANQYFQLTPIN